ncbi:hypothetical protein MTBBW1_1650002 [Desulfamplus magnetovallimortis]|uniref:Beta-lactamase-related domain-containing protein n=1 Tax=Desulfamplus magnetovallimortis TaxID=1246637 RepID=A0A1W1H8Y5_9BACT|nr:serine hydrolase domain-containing protein [Desulfamplus magnetovallimortis]SLM28960.1 hypothetical protein MTBBW1_1650002 [Desulfamplus magnetovallimortis]
MHSLLSSVMTKALDDEIFPGAVLLVSHKGNILYHEPFGVADLDTQDKISHESFFDLASLTKPLATALSFMKLVETGLVSLETKVCEIIDDFRVSDKSRISIDHLLRHTSGLASHRPFFESIKCETSGWSFEKGKEVQSMIRRSIVNEKLESLPGQCQKYSDLGYMVLCWIVEEVTGRLFDEYVYGELFAPMEIGDLFFVRLPPAQKEIISSIPQSFEALHTQNFNRSVFVSTEKCPWRKKLCGERFMMIMHGLQVVLMGMPVYLVRHTLSGNS